MGEKRNIRIIGLDPGTKTTGVVILDYDFDNPFDIKPVFVETIQSKLSLRNLKGLAGLNGERFGLIKTVGVQLYRLLDIYKPDFVVAESSYSGSFATTFQALSELMFEIKQSVYDYSPITQVNVIDPASVKKFMGVKGNSNDKDLMTKALNSYLKKLGITFNVNQIDEHSVDAFCIALYLHAQLVGSE